LKDAAHCGAKESKLK